jgi:hypothetical protein
MAMKSSSNIPIYIDPIKFLVFSVTDDAFVPVPLILWQGRFTGTTQFHGSYERKPLALCPWRNRVFHQADPKARFLIFKPLIPFF